MMRSVFSLPPSLRHRDFRLLWLGQLVSIVGTMMQNAAILWHVSEVQRDPAWAAVALGGVGLVRVIPIIGLSFVSGMAADRYDRRRIMILSQIGMGLCALLLGWLAWANVAALWPIYVLAALSAACSAFDLPARQALLPALVPREDLPNAFSVNAAMWQAAAIVGPALSGFIIDAYGLHVAYWFNALSFVAVIAALVLMHTRSAVAAEERPPVSLAAALEGLRFVRRTPIVLSTMMLDFFATFFSSATALLPIYARNILYVGARGYGILASAEACGAFITGLILTFVPRIPRQGRTLVIAVACYGLSTILFGFSTTFLLAFIGLAGVGASDTVSMVIRNTIRQLHTPDYVRGRMVSVNMIFFMGGPQLGELEAGLVAGWLGAPLSVISGGLGCLIALAWVVRQWPEVWRYDQSPELDSRPAAAD